MCNSTGKCYTCPKCGLTVYYGAYHFCYPPYRNDSGFNYKCPCGGEFNSPAYDSGTGTYFPAKCPFCGKEMVGLNQ